MADPNLIPKSKRNWWKYGFFLVLFLLECAREIIVLESASSAEPNARAIFVQGDDYVEASGIWTRIDSGAPLTPVIIHISCRVRVGKCIETSVNMSDRQVFAPNVEWFDASFRSDSVVYENDFPTCARYTVRIDFKLKKVFSTREMKGNQTDPICSPLEKRIELQLVDSQSILNDKKKGHFLPIFTSLDAVF